MNDRSCDIKESVTKKSGFLNLDDLVALLLLSVPLVFSLASLLLADLRCFSLGALCAVTFPILIAGTIWAIRISDIRFHLSRNWIFCLLGIVVLSGITLAPPYTYLHGGWDPGEYVCTAMNISRTGSITIEDKDFAGFDEEVRHALMHEPNGTRKTLQPGYLVEQRAESGERRAESVEQETGIFTPDYFHLYPAWLAGFGSVAGLHGTYWGQWVISILAAAMFFMAVRELFGSRVALAASLLLIAGPAQIYFGRFTSSEMLMRLFVFSAFYWYSRTLRESRIVFDILAGFSLASAFLTHSTTVLPAIGILGFLFVLALHFRTAAIWRTLIISVIFLLFAFTRNAVMASTVSSFLFGFILAHPKLIFPAVLLGGCAVGFLAKIRFSRNAGAIWFRWWIPGILLVLYLVFMYFLRPIWFLNDNAINMRIIGWCVCPVSLLFFAAFFLRERWSLWSRGVMLFVSASALTCVVLIAHRMAHPLLMWSLRRYVPVVIPFFIVISAVPLAGMLSARGYFRKTVGYVVLLISIAYLVHGALPALLVREHSGLPDFVEKIAEATGDADFILCDHWRYSTPLRYAMGLPAYQFSRQSSSTDSGEAETLMNLLSGKVLSGESVYYVTAGNAFFHPNFRLVPVWTGQTNSEILALTKKKLPRSVRSLNQQITVFQCVPLTKTEKDVGLFEGVEIDVGYHSMGLLSGFYKWRKPGDSGYRWTDGCGKLYVPVRKSRMIPVTVRLASGRPKNFADVPVTISVDGREVAKFGIGRSWEKHSFMLPSNSAGTSVVRFEISSPIWNPADAGISGYPDELGVRVDWIRMGVRQ